MNNELSDIIEGLKGYLNYLKIMGINEIPLTKRGQGVKDSRVQVKINSFTLEPPNPLTPEPFKIESLEDIRNEIGDCKRCKLCHKRKNIVFGSGKPKAELMFVGEGPGEDEDIQGLPFVGRAGQKLTEIIEKGMGLKRKDVYICNIVKCRPPGNREPEPDEVATCKPFLEKQIAVIKPKVIVSLGRPATATLLNSKKITISKIRGIWQEYISNDGTVIKLMPTYHPAYLLRNYTYEVRKQVHDDMKKVVEELKKG
jgi:DNA polymerase